jgi:hypothetical protein
VYLPMSLIRRHGLNAGGGGGARGGTPVFRPALSVVFFSPFMQLPGKLIRRGMAMAFQSSSNYERYNEKLSLCLSTTA